MNISVVGIDLIKTEFQLYALDADGNAQKRRVFYYRL
jgi:hypothetical protein